MFGRNPYFSGFEKQVSRAFSGDERFQHLNQSPNSYDWTNRLKESLKQYLNCQNNHIVGHGVIFTSSFSLKFRNLADKTKS